MLNIYRLKLKKLSKKENFNLNLIKIENDAIKNFYKDALSRKKEVKELLESDMIDDELNLAEQDVNKTLNMTKHRGEIFNRPKK